PQPARVRYPLSLHDALPISLASVLPLGENFTENTWPAGLVSTPLARGRSRSLTSQSMTDEPRDSMSSPQQASDLLSGAKASDRRDRKSTRLNSSHGSISYAV